MGNSGETGAKVIGHDFGRGFALEVWDCLERCMIDIFHNGVRTTGRQHHSSPFPKIMKLSIPICRPQFYRRLRAGSFRDMRLRGELGSLRRPVGRRRSSLRRHKDPGTLELCRAGGRRSSRRRSSLLLLPSEFVCFRLCFETPYPEPKSS